MQKDLAWAIAGSMGSENQNKLIASWTDFNKKGTNVDQRKSLLENLPTIAETPEYPVCKKFLNDLISLIEELDLDHIFAHSDEQVYARLAHIIWKEPQLYKDIIILMGGFHQLRVIQKISFKRHSIKGHQKWVVDTETVLFGSEGASDEGRHYYRDMRINKETFCALVQFRFENITKKYQDLPHTLK